MLSRKSKFDSRDVIYLRMLIPAVSEPAIVGHNGHNIAKLQALTNTHITCFGYMPNTLNEKDYVIRGTPGAILRALECILYVVQRTARFQIRRHDDLTFDVGVGRYKVLMIMATNTLGSFLSDEQGFNLVNVVQWSGARITILPKPKFQYVIITGEMPNLLLAAKMILVKISESKRGFRKSPVGQHPEPGYLTGEAETMKKIHYIYDDSNEDNLKSEYYSQKHWIISREVEGNRMKFAILDEHGKHHCNASCKFNLLCPTYKMTTKSDKHSSSLPNTPLILSPKNELPYLLLSHAPDGCDRLDTNQYVQGGRAILGVKHVVNTNPQISESCSLQSQTRVESRFQCPLGIECSDYVSLEKPPTVEEIIGGADLLEKNLMSLLTIDRSQSRENRLVSEESDSSYEGIASALRDYAKLNASAYAFLSAEDPDMPNLGGASDESLASILERDLSYVSMSKTGYFASLLEQNHSSVPTDYVPFGSSASDKQQSAMLDISLAQQEQPPSRPNNNFVSPLQGDRSFPRTNELYRAIVEARAISRPDNRQNPMMLRDFYNSTLPSDALVWMPDSEDNYLFYAGLYPPVQYNQNQISATNFPDEYLVNTVWNLDPDSMAMCIS